ncbi:hypothetical protein B0H13DRAFT_1586946, partial [Mycena leptocephala]
LKLSAVLVTGASVGGIGFETARAIAKHANLVIIAGHNLDRLKTAEDTIKSEVPSANIRPLVLDLSSLAAVRKAAAEANAFPEPLHRLYRYQSSAAAPIGPFTLTVDNLESQLATAQVTPFLFIKLLFPKILAARIELYTPRVVFVSSFGQNFCKGVDLDALARPNAASYEPTDYCFQAKAANLLCASELNRRAKGRINAYSLPHSCSASKSIPDRSNNDVSALT